MNSGKIQQMSLEKMLRVRNPSVNLFGMNANLLALIIPIVQSIFTFDFRNQVSVDLYWNFWFNFD